MARRSPVRLLAPLALLACIAALFGIVSGRTDDGESASPSTQTQPRGSSSREAQRPRRRTPRFYSVKQGDTLASVAERYKTTVDRLLELNENRDIDPQTLRPGMRIRLRR